MSPFSGRTTKESTNSKGSNSKQFKLVVEESTLEPKFPIGQYDYIDGRNFYRTEIKNNYLLPCDDEEVERLEVNHLLAKLYFSPIEEQLKQGIRVLEVGTGPGWWLQDMAKDFPASHFTGTDIMFFPNNPPTNCHYRIADVSKGLPFADNTFDFVVQRDAMYRFSRTHWDFVLNELIRVAKPGAYLELVESSGTINDIGPNSSVWLMRLTVSLQTRNIHPKIAPQISQMVIDTGRVTDVVGSHRSIPIGWLGKLGDVALESMERLFDSMKPRLCEDWSMSSAKYDKVTQSASKEFRDFKSWSNFHYVSFRKMTDQERSETATPSSTTTLTPDDTDVESKGSSSSIKQ
ncbi:S-adenosyl-L-methionine-dependent methyltransferase [Phycomyces blakesleeanus]|uniref:S-adenosyl-L-methionine-dependent methyltransferase n=1 Tax=Phycomyces blakesleeanus TaxID=4837 RepID=A0ABR3BCN3_PHYBL